MGYIETRQECRGRCIVCGDEKYFRQVSYLVNFDPEVDGWNLANVDFPAAQAEDHDYYTDCSCTTHERIAPNGEMSTTKLSDGSVWVTLHCDGSNGVAADHHFEIRKNGRRSFRVVETADWPVRTIGPVYRSRHEAVAAFNAAIEGTKAWCRQTIPAWAAAEAIFSATPDVD